MGQIPLLAQEEVFVVEGAVGWDETWEEAGVAALGT